MFDPEIAEIRFGTGLSPKVAPPRSADQMLNRLVGPDTYGQAYPYPKFSQIEPSLATFRDARLARRDAETEAAEDAARSVEMGLNDQANSLFRTGLMTTMTRAIETRDGLRERLVRFWADHFTVVAQRFSFKHFVAAYVEETIRPNITGQFEDLLIAAVTHPMMVSYLNQNQSVGPNSERGLARGQGLNENLAREILELHSLGVGGSYSQTDVRQLAELLTGLTYRTEDGRAFYHSWAEPGAETVLGKTYGSDEKAQFDDIEEALRDIARHPDTAKHIATKLAVHFVSDDPDPDLVGQMEAAFLATQGNLAAVVAAMLDHRAAWAPELTKAKPPIGFLETAFRAFGLPAQTLLDFNDRDKVRHVLRPLGRMGQQWEAPIGPDGFPEKDTAWLTPQGLASRVDWAFQHPRTLFEELPDPRDFVITALGSRATPEVLFAAKAAETRKDGIGLILSSAPFQRR